MPPAKDISGQMYGYLKAIKNTGRKERGSYIWEFECICGAKIERRIGLVTGGQIVSCGCHKAKNLLTKPSKEKLGLKFGTNVSRIQSTNLQKNNTSGHKGVSLHHQAGKSDRWIAYIYFQGHRYYLGSYEDINDAINARMEAEGKLFGEFLTWYSEYRKAGQNDKK